MNSFFFVNGCWEKTSQDDYRCRWFACWKEIDNEVFVGALCGYSGHGSFELEKFVATIANDKVTKFLFDFKDGISGLEIDFSALDEKYLTVCEDALDVLFDWNDADVFEEYDRLVLQKEKFQQCTFSGDLCFASNRESIHLSKFFSLIGLTASPS
jgi:hypothetical protein